MFMWEKKKAYDKILELEINIFRAGELYEIIYSGRIYE